MPTRKTAGFILQLLGVCVFLVIPGLGGHPSAERRAVGAVPSPRAVLGFEPGDDYTLADFRQLREYFRRLDAASDRVELRVAGHSTEGNEMLVAIISSEANLARLERYRDISRRLALVRGVTDVEARALAREGKAVVWIDSGLHASEVATAQHAIRLAHEVATEDTPEMQAVRENVVLVLAPCINPDGMNMVVDWYRRTLRTPHQDSAMPWLYQKYVGHDNNRDGYMQTQKETQVVNRLLFAEWLPQIMYNQHQGTYPPRIFVPPFPDPVNPNIDPQIVRGVDLVGGAMQDRFEREGKNGVISRYAFSIWYNGSVRTTSYFHNIIGILTETGHAIGDAVHVRSLAIPTNALERGGHARAQRDLSEPVEGRHPAPPGCGRVHADRLDGGPRSRGEVPRALSLWHLPGRRAADCEGPDRGTGCLCRPHAPARWTRQPGVHRHADERRHRGAPRVAAVRRRRHLISRGHVRGAARATIPAFCEGSPRTAVLPGSPHACRRPAAAAL